MKVYSIIDGKFVGTTDQIFPTLTLEQIVKSIAVGFVIVH